MCRCLVKFILFAVNLIFLLIGLSVVGAGVYAIYQLNNITQLIENLPFDFNINFIPYVIITLGVIVFLISFSGCCGTITETKCLLITYAVCMAFLAATKIVLTILLFVNLPNFTNTVETTLNDMFKSEDTYQNATFHGLETILKCCGTTGPDAYVNDYNLAAPTCCEQGGTTTSSIGNLPIDNLPIANLTTKNLQRENAPIDVGNLPADIGDVDLGGVDLGGIDLGGIDLGGIDLGNLGNLTACKKEDAFETGCTRMITGAVKTIGKAFGNGLIGVIVFEVSAMLLSIYLIETMRPKHPIYIEQPRYYY